ncbi:MAG: glycosyltransferase family 4 protein [Lachnospiraceae bacterium]|nr:glycosyltransferase family 4 protein [Lachnospiraceae bacterium]
MRILAVSHEYPPLGGGGANAANHLLNGLADRGYAVTLITTAHNRPDTDRKKLTMIEVPSARKRTGSCSFAEMADFVLKARKAAVKAVREANSSGQPYDLCLVFFGIPSGPIGQRLKKKYGIPYIIRFGGGDIPGFQKRFTRVYKVLAPAIRQVWKHADARIANSSGLKEMALSFCGRYDFAVIPNGVNTEFFRPDADRRDPEEIRILFVSRLIERKGLQHVIPMLKTLPDSTDKKVRLMVVGEGPYRDRLQQITEEQQVTEMVRFLGEKRGEELAGIYRQADIFILPSSNEGMPNVVLEAMASGLPVMMTPCQGSGELIDGNGYIADLPAFGERLAELIRDDTLRNKMGEVSRNRAETLFSWDRTISAYDEMITKVVTG